jgi:hypothetical protein
MRGPVTVGQLIEAVGRLDQHGEGTTLREVAWELVVDERRVEDAWARARFEGLIRCDRRRGSDEKRCRLTPGGWAALADARQAAG